MTPPRSDVDLLSQLADELDARLVGPVRSLLGVDLAEQLADRLTACAPMLAGQLTSGDDRLVVETVIDVMHALWGVDDPPQRWWRTPLGVRCAASLAGQRDGAFSRRAAAGMLGVHVGTVDQLLSRGTLDRHPDGGVTAGSVLARVARLHGGDAERGDDHTACGRVALRQEQHADAEASRRLITREDLVDALLWTGDEGELADVLHVDVHMVQVRLRAMTEEERAGIWAELDEREAGLPWA